MAQARVAAEARWSRRPAPWVVRELAEVEQLAAAKKKAEGA